MLLCYSQIGLEEGKHGQPRIHSFCYSLLGHTARRLAGSNAGNLVTQRAERHSTGNALILPQRDASLNTGGGMLATPQHRRITHTLKILDQSEDMLQGMA